jgi:hypothetical protein
MSSIEVVRLLDWLRIGVAFAPREPHSAPRDNQDQFLLKDVA